MAEKLSELILRRESHSPPTLQQIEECYSNAIDDTLAKIAHARKAENSTTYSDLGGRLDDLRADLRESVQAITRKPMWEIIVKLRQGGDISEEEMKLIRLWIVGDAASYIEEENNVGDWLEELDRLTDEIRSRRQVPVDAEGLEALHALLTDARGVVRSIAGFLNDRERVERFEESTRNGLDESSRETLANILARSYNSPVV